VYNLPDNFDIILDKVREFEDKVKDIHKRNNNIHNYMSVVSTKVDSLEMSNRVTE
jgi:hypothetical protein